MSSLNGNCCVIRGGKVHIAPYMPPVIVAGKPQYPYAWRDMGEVSMAEVKVESDTKERATHRNPAGGLSCSFTRIKNATLSMKLDCSSADNIALASLGIKTDVTGFPVVGELRIVVKNPNNVTPVALDYLIDESQPIDVQRPPPAGGAGFVLGVDYFIDHGLLYLSANTAVQSSVAPAYAPAIQVNYTARPQQHVQAGLVPSGQFAVQFNGFEVGSGTAHAYLAGVRYAQIKPSGIQLINDDFSEILLDFDLLPDPALAAFPTLSPYYYGQFAANLGI